MKEEKAITLISLVITIILLILLSGIAINLSFGENGLFNKTKQAKEKYINEEASEIEQLNSLTNEIDSIIGSNNVQTLYAEIFSFTPENSNWKVHNVKEALDYLYNN